MKVVELTIDDFDEMGGLDAISIVEKPAHESLFLAFNDGNKPLEIYEQLDADQLHELSLAMGQLGEPMGQLEEEGYVLYKIEDAIPEKEMFYTSNPNASVEADFLPRIRYKYTHPRPAGRVFCQALIDAQRVYTEDDIQALSSLNPVGPADYNVLSWRGSYNCRGKWSKLTYLPKDQMGTIINDSNSRKGLVSEEEGVLFDTRTQATINKGNTPQPRVGGWFNKEEFGIIGMIDDMPVFETKVQAEIIADKIGCKGSHEHKLDGGVVGFMPCEKHEDTSDAMLKGVVKENFETYDDYPKEASENACRVLRWIDEHGRDEVSGMERTGLARANSLCKREKISTETIGRMAAFERHRKNSVISPEFKGTPWKDKGYVAWLAWGGDAGIEWAQRKLDQLAKEMSVDVSSLSPYVSQTGKTISESMAEVGERGAIKPSKKAPKSDTKNPNPKGEGSAKGDASTTRGAKVDKETEKTLKEKSDDWNERYKEKRGYGTNVGMLKAVYQRGLGAYNVSHSPNVSSSKQWAMARVNAFLLLMKDGRPQNKKYTGDFDLLPKKHPKSEKMSSCGCGDDGKDEVCNLQFSTDEEKMEITGAALIPNKMIIRRSAPTLLNPQGEFYYVFFSEETIVKLQEKFMREKRLDDTNIEHSETEADSYVKESWIVEDPIFDKSTAMGLEYPKGTWVITMKVQNDKVWKDIKNGKLNGYSVEGWFNENLLFQ